MLKKVDCDRTYCRKITFNRIFIMHNVQKNHTTDMQLKDLKLDSGISSKKFTERMMKRGI